MLKLLEVEYRVKEKVTYFVTRYCKYGTEQDHVVSVTQEGSFENSLSAQRAATALMEWERSLVASEGAKITGPEPLSYHRSPS